MEWPTASKGHNRLNTQSNLSPVKIRKGSLSKIYPTEKGQKIGGHQPKMEKRSGSIHFNTNKVIKPPPLNINEDQTAASSKGLLNSMQRRGNHTALRSPTGSESPNFKFDQINKTSQRRRLDPLKFKNVRTKNKDSMYATMQPSDLNQMLITQQDKSV